MNGHTKMPAVTFEDGADYDTLHSMITGWCARIWLTDGVILVALWLGPVGSPGEEMLGLNVWSNADQDYTTPLSIPMDNVTRVSVI